MSRLIAVLAAALVALAACGVPGPSPSPTPAVAPTPEVSSTPGTGTSAPASPQPTPAPAGSPLPGDTAALYRAIEDQVVAERGLAAKARLEPTILSQAEVRARLGDQFRQDNPPAEIEIAEETLKALGLLPADASLGDLYVDLLGSQVAGYYDSKAHQLFVVSRSGAIGATEKVTFAHEFTHALQNQHFGLEEIDVDAVGQGDRSLARLAVVEGDASLLMTRWLTAHLTPAEIQELLVVDPAAQAQLAQMPAILRDTLLFPYAQGLSLVTRLWLKGGWEAVDRAFERLPDSTEQVLHPAKYEANEKPTAVTLDSASLAAAMGAGWSATPEDTLGELQLSIWLRENGVASSAAEAAAAGWGGDRMAYLRGPGGEHALALRTAWDSAADADEFGAAARTAAAHLPGAAEVLDDAGSVWVLAGSSSASLGSLRRAVLATSP